MSLEYTKPLPVIDVWNQPFWEGAKEHKLMAQKCSDCNEFRFPPGPACPNCFSENFTWVQLSGQGTVKSWVVFNQLYYDGFKEDLPYNVATIELDEGVKIISNLVGLNNDQIYIGMKVQVVFEDVTEDITIPKFTPTPIS
jgi:uncharacterized protein